MTRIVLSGGGTAGHIHPAIALGEELSSRGVEVFFAGTPQGLEGRIVKEAGFPFTAFEATGFDRSRPWTALSGINSILRSTKHARRWFEEIKPQAVVGFGAYVSIPVARAALSLALPLVIHEQNSVMGMANRYLAKHANAVCLTYADTKPDLEAKATVYVTGNPVRRAVTEASRSEGRARYGVEEGTKLLLIFGGSLGARSINNEAIALKDELLGRREWHIVHLSGPKEYESVVEALALTEEEQRRWLVKGYEDEMGLALAATDLIWSRAGASSLAEIAARSIPAVLVPYPFAREDHQTTNAKSLAKEGGAIVFADDQMESAAFRDTLLGLLDDPLALEALKQAAASNPGSKAAAALADVVLGLVESS